MKTQAQEKMEEARGEIREGCYLHNNGIERIKLQGISDDIAPSLLSMTCLQVISDRLKLIAAQNDRLIELHEWAIKKQFPGDTGGSDYPNGVNL